MSLPRKIVKKYREDGLYSLATSSLPFFRSRARYYGLDLPAEILINRKSYNIYEEEWDLLIILDACRYDLMESVSADYPFLSQLEPRYSPASSSQEWLQHQFSPAYRIEMEETAYVTGNTFSNEMLDETEFETLDEVWTYGWDEESGIVLPRPITDRTITVARNQDPDRVIAHYMQPHFPALENPELGGKVDPTENKWINSIWDQLESSELTYKTVWNAYKSNLREVLTEVELLLNNTDFDNVIITADHGNGFGELGIYGHPSNRTHPCLRKVPWVKTTAQDIGDYIPQEYNRESDEISLEDRLAALGYL